MSPARPRVLSHHGLHLVAPPGWSARIYLRDAPAGAVGHPTLHAATFPLPASRGDFGSGAAALMSVDDALVVLLEYGPASLGTALFAAAGLPRPRAADFSPRALQRTLPGQSGFQRFFTWGGRPFCLYVVLGSHHRRLALAQRVEALLAGVSVTYRPSGAAAAPVRRAAVEGGGG